MRVGNDGGNAGGRCGECLVANFKRPEVTPAFVGFVAVLGESGFKAVRTRYSECLLLLSIGCGWMCWEGGCGEGCWEGCGEG